MWYVYMSAVNTLLNTSVILYLSDAQKMLRPALKLSTVPNHSHVSRIRTKSFVRHY